MTKKEILAELINSLIFTNNYQALDYALDDILTDDSKLTLESREYLINKAIQIHDKALSDIDINKLNIRG